MLYIFMLTPAAWDNLFNIVLLLAMGKKINKQRTQDTATIQKLAGCSLLFNVLPKQCFTKRIYFTSHNHRKSR